MISASSKLPLTGLLTLALSALSARAQWVTESYDLKPGWNAVWLPLDVSHAADILSLAAGDIEELWRWNASEAGHFTDTPAGPPSQTQLEWSVWRRTSPEGTTLGLLTGNAAYLVKVADTAAPFTWSVKGKPLPPAFEWSSTGLNFVGFPLQDPPSSALRSVGRFFGFNTVLKSLPPTLFYNGGPLSDVAPKNPLRITSFTTTAAVRGRAYWVQADAYTDYYGPVKVEVGGMNGLDFGTERLTTAVRLVNVVDPVRNQTVTVTLSPVASEAPPAGQAAIAGAVPLLVRGAFNATTGRHSYDPFSGPITRVLAPGESTEVIFTVKRNDMGNTPGAAFQSLISVTDSLNQTRITLPVRAETTSRAGLWVGAASVGTVDKIIGANATPEPVKSQFQLRLLVHEDANGTVRLLQQAYAGEHQGQPAVASVEAAFVSPSKAASRASSAHFPAGLKRSGTGRLGLSGDVSFTLSLGNDDASNPFVHKYHPDHDNLDARFEQVLVAGRESPAITRQITLTFAGQSPLGYDPAWGATSLGGTYTETVTGLRAVPITSSGTFLIQRAANAATFLNP